MSENTKQPDAAEKLMNEEALLSALALDTALLGDGHEAAANEFSKEAARRRKEAEAMRSNTQ